MSDPDSRQNCLDQQYWQGIIFPQNGIYLYGICLLVSWSMYSLARPKSTMKIVLSFFMLVLGLQAEIQIRENSCRVTTPQTLDKRNNYTLNKKQELKNNKKLKTINTKSFLPADQKILRFDVPEIARSLYTLGFFQ